MLRCGARWEKKRRFKKNNNVTMLFHRRSLNCSTTATKRRDSAFLFLRREAEANDPLLVTPTRKETGVACSRKEALRALARTHARTVTRCSVRQLQPKLWPQKQHTHSQVTTSSHGDAPHEGRWRIFESCFYVARCLASWMLEWSVTERSRRLLVSGEGPRDKPNTPLSSGLSALPLGL